MKHSKAIFLIITALMLISITGLAEASQEYPAEWDNFWDSSDEAAFFMGLGLTMCLIIFLIPLIIAILLCIWIYKDAEKRGKSGGLWVLLLILATLFFNIIGLIVIIIIWLAVRPPIGGERHEPSTAPYPERRCPGCGRVIPDDARVCPYCGKKFEE